jgi:hypothetical protein
MERLTARFARLRLDTARTFPRVQTVIFEISRAAGTSGRAYAMYDYRDHVLTVAPRLLAASNDRQEAILRHELGHAVDAFYATATIRRRLWLDGRRDWQATPERLADAIAFGLWDEPIRYDDDDVQTLGPGVSPRPRRLGW